MAGTRAEVSRTNVLMLNYEYPPLGGGAGVATRYLLRALDKRADIRAVLITSSLDTSHISFTFPNAAVHYLDIGKKGSIHYQTERDLLTFAARAFFHARRLHRATPFDVVHAFFGIPCGGVARLLGLPYIVSLRGSDVPFYNPRFAHLDMLVFKRLSRAIWRNAAVVTTNSAGLKALALKTAPEQAIEVIYNGVDTTFFSPTTKQRTGQTLTLVSTGRLIARKGYVHLIEALAGLPGICLRLLGEGNQLAMLRNLATQHRVDVEFLGARSREEVAAYLKESDLFVLPSLNEGMSNSLLEAMASGLPVVVTDVGGSRELVDGNGIIVEKANADALRSAILTYRNNGALIPAHGAISRQRALEMNIDTMADQYAALYRSVVREASSR
jgi:glycosyltransferase involved in cell wall biosynthesis